MWRLWGTLASLVVAVVALIVAVKSSRDARVAARLLRSAALEVAERSAAASERSTEVAERSAAASERSADAAERTEASARDGTAELTNEAVRLAARQQRPRREQVDMQRIEHEAFSAEHARRPVLTLGVLCILPDEVTDGRVSKAKLTTANRQVEIRCPKRRNPSRGESQRNVVTPEWLSMRWSYSNGAEVEAARPAAPSPVEHGPIIDALGAEHRNQVPRGARRDPRTCS